MLHTLHFQTTTQRCPLVGSILYQSQPAKPSASFIQPSRHNIVRYCSACCNRVHARTAPLQAWAACTISKTLIISAESVLRFQTLQTLGRSDCFGPVYELDRPEPWQGRGHIGWEEAKANSFCNFLLDHSSRREPQRLPVD